MMNEPYRPGQMPVVAGFEPMVFVRKALPSPVHHRHRVADDASDQHEQDQQCRDEGEEQHHQHHHAGDVSLRRGQLRCGDLARGLAGLRRVS